MQIKSRNKAKLETSLTPPGSGNSPIIAQDEESAIGNGMPLRRPASSPLVSILRKLCSTHNSRNEQDGTFVMNILKDMIGGAILGILFVLVLIFLDYRNVIHISSARVLREAAFELITDPQTIRFVEESTDMKFVSSDIYNAMKDEIKKSEDKIEAKKAEITDNEEKLEKYLSEKGLIEKEYEELTAKANVVFGLDKFCAECSWQGRTSCQARMDFFMERYGNTPMQAKIAMVALPQCVKKE